MRVFNETEKQTIKGLQSARYTYKQINRVIELIKYHIALGEKVTNASIDPQEFTIKFSSGHRYEIAKEL